MAACPPPTVINVCKIACANKWTYFLIFMNLLMLAILALMIMPFIRIVPQTGAIIREFLFAVFNDN